MKNWKDSGKMDWFYSSNELVFIHRSEPYCSQEEKNRKTTFPTHTHTEDKETNYLNETVCIAGSLLSSLSKCIAASLNL